VHSKKGKIDMSGVYEKREKRKEPEWFMIGGGKSEGSSGRTGGRGHQDGLNPSKKPAPTTERENLKVGTCWKVT